MQIVKYDTIKSEIISNVRRKMLIPVVGSGFTKDCNAREGKVPTGKEYRQKMMEMILNSSSDMISEDEKDELERSSFAKISGLYHQIVEPQVQRVFYRDNFTKVKIGDRRKQKFLSCSWPYIYTLNIDDGIENSDNSYHVICSNRKVSDDIFDDNKCLVKLHGDVHEILTYEDSNSEVFDQAQYARSISNNKSLLNRLKHDWEYSNLLFIGCSLSEEIDILSFDKNAVVDSSKYYFSSSKLNCLTRANLEMMGITHFVEFESVEEMYDCLEEIGVEGMKLTEDDLEGCISYKYNNLSSNREANLPYLLQGKSLIQLSQTIVVPHFFIHRKVADTILANMRTGPVQILLGAACSGKTFALIDVARKVANKDVYIFESKDKISKEAFNRLLQKKNTLIIADSLSLDKEQIETILCRREEIRSNNTHIVIAARKSNRDIHSTIQYLIRKGELLENSIPIIQVSNKLNAEETNDINEKLTMISSGQFLSNRTIADNIIEISKQLGDRNQFSQKEPVLNDPKEIAALICLAIERKLYTKTVVGLDLVNELNNQQNATLPLIEREETWSFERSPSDNSRWKYVLNAEYWLYKWLDECSRSERNIDLILKAFEYIIDKLIQLHGKPSLLYDDKDAAYKEYIRFDNINQIFRDADLKLIRKIYEKLNELLSTDPQYLHQRAKCYIRSALISKNKKEAINFLDAANYDAVTAQGTFFNRYKQSKNEKVFISYSHVAYTIALAKCHKCRLLEYKDISMNTEAIRLLEKAFSYPANSYDEFAKTDPYNDNVISDIVITITTNSKLIDESAKRDVEKLFKKIARWD